MNTYSLVYIHTDGRTVSLGDYVAETADDAAAAAAAERHGMDAGRIAVAGVST